jgi:hypothetical protein
MKKTILVTAIMAFPVIAAADGSPWLPVPGSTQVSVGYISQAGDEFYLATDETPLPETLKQDTYSVSVQHGLSDVLAIDARLNYAKISFDPNSESAFADSSIGVNWRVYDEFEHAAAPTITLRGAAIIAGNYETGKIDAIGDDASGVELSVLAGKYLMPRLTVAGEFGYRYRSGEVPDDLWFSANVGYSLASFVSVSAGYIATRSLGDLDIGGPGFSAPRFPEVQEDRDLVSVGAAFSVADSTSLNINYGTVISGRNTTKADVWGISVTTSF